jgi:translation initiation factor 1
VYSTDGGRIAPAKGRGAVSQRQTSGRTEPPDDGIVRIQRDKRGRGGKTATTITGLPGDEAALDALLRDLKQHCGAGGSREGRLLAVQGDQRERLQTRLTAMGYRVKLAGG